jgi:hypothetical protein
LIGNQPVSLNRSTASRVDTKEYRLETPSIGSIAPAAEAKWIIWSLVMLKVKLVFMFMVLPPLDKLIKKGDKTPIGEFCPPGENCNK